MDLVVVAILEFSAAIFAMRAGAPAEVPSCHVAVASPVYQGVGWTHFVDVLNECEADLVCAVATTVDPAPAYRVRVPVGETVRVRTRYGSSSWVFEPIVVCDQERAARSIDPCQRR